MARPKDRDRSPPRLWSHLGVAVLVVAVVIRHVALADFEETAASRFPQVDAYTYWDQAKAMFAGKDPFEGGYYQPPGYPWLLAAVFRMVDEASLHVARVFNVLLGLCSTALVLWMGNRVGRRLERPWMGPAAAALFTLYPPVILFEHDILTPAVTTFLFLVVLALLWRSDRPGPLRAGLSGVFLGGIATIHPTYLLALPALGVALWRWGQGRWKKPVAALVLGTAVGVAPTALTNAVRWGEAALVSHNAGLNFYLANNPQWRETSFLRPGIPFRELVLEAEPAERDQFERNDYWRRRALRELSEQPTALVDALLTRARWSVSNREIPRNEEHRCRTREGPLTWVGWLPVRYGWVFPFAVLGAVRLWPRSRRGRAAVLSWGALHGVMLVFFVADRYRLATWPLVCLLAACGLGDLLRWAARRGEPPLRARWAWALWGVTVILPWLPLESQVRFQPGWCHHLQGNFAVSEKRWEDAEEAYRRAIELDPDDEGARRWLAETLYRAGRYEEAAAALRPVVESFPNHHPSQMLMVRIYEKLHDWRAAARHAGLAYRIPGPRTNTGIRYLRNLLRAGQEGLARQVASQDPRLAEHPDVREMLYGEGGGGR